MVKSMAIEGALIGGVLLVLNFLLRSNTHAVVANSRTWFHVFFLTWVMR